MTRHAGWAVLSGLLALSVAAALLALRYGLWEDGEPGPGLFPLAACGLMAVAAVAVGWELRQPPVLVEAEEASVPTPVRLAGTIAVMVLWPFLLVPLGYALASGLALVGLLRLGHLGWPSSLAIAGAAVAGTHLLFVVLLDVPLPGARWL